MADPVNPAPPVQDPPVQQQVQQVQQVQQIQTPPAVDPMVAVLQDRLMRAEVKREAQRLGIVDPSLVDHLPVSGAKVEADGRVSGIDTAIASLRSAHPAIFQAAQGSTVTTPAPTVTQPAPQQVQGQPPAVATGPAQVQTTVNTAPPPQGNGAPPKVDVTKLNKQDYAQAKKAARDLMSRA